ncbi:aspartate dehydrogenase domain-containing protein [Salipiger mucosus]|nr:aspartate dehydrogenase domain-containing protein [Salipiger mucosus]
MTAIVLGGFGNVGQQIAARLAETGDTRIEIVAIAARDHDKARKAAAKLGLDVPVIDAAEAPDHDAVLVECATYEGFRDVVEPTLRAGGHVIAISVGALGANLDLIDLTEQSGATLQIAGGTLPGLDILRAAREGEIRSVRLTSHIHPASLAKEPYIHDNGIDLGPADTTPVPIFEGSAREAARHFPRHFNVAVTLGLAGIGLDATEVRIRADGTLPGARHTLAVDSDAVQLEMHSQNFPSPRNNRTSRIVSQSILAALRRLDGGLQVGS